MLQCHIQHEPGSDVITLGWRSRILPNSSVLPYSLGGTLEHYSSAIVISGFTLDVTSQPWNDVISSPFFLYYLVKQWQGTDAAEWEVSHWSWRRPGSHIFHTAFAGCCWPIHAPISHYGISWLCQSQAAFFLGGGVPLWLIKRLESLVMVLDCLGQQERQERN